MINYLKEQIALKAGRKIQNRGDCEYLSQLIEIETGEYLNYNTLRRFFGIDKKEFKPRKASLDILSRYIGYRSFDHLSASHPHKMLFDQNQKTYELLLEFDPTSLASYYKKLSFNSKLNYITDVCRHGILTKQIEQLCLTLDNMRIEFDYFSYDEVVVIGNSIGPLLRKIELREKDWEKILNNYFFNKFIFEIFVDYSSLNSYYYHFLVHPPFDKQQQLFKLSLRCLRDYLNLNKTKSGKELLNQCKQADLHPILFGRVLSLPLYHEESVIEEFKKIDSLSLEHLYEPMVATITTSKFELYELIKRVLSKNFKSQIYRHAHYYQVYLLMKSCYLYKTGQFKKAIKSLKEIDLSDLRFSYKGFLSFFYFLLDFKLTGKSTSRLKIDEINEKLGYKRFDMNFVEKY